MDSQQYVRRDWCVRLALGLIALGAVLNVIFLFNHCPLDLVEDETHYWEWARHLDYGYYSKPPGIGWVIAGAVKLAGAFGVAGDGASLAPWVRLPAVLFAFFSGLLTLALGRRIFRDDRAGLAVILLGAAVPMFAVGSLLITIDSPMYLCWAATVYALWRFVESRATKWIYLAGLAAAIGMMFKPVLIAIPICVALAAYFSPAIGSVLKTRHTFFASLLILLSQVPVVIWNAAHNWVTFKHIATQGVGNSSGEQTNYFAATGKRFGEFLGGQAGPMGGIIFVLLIVAIMVAFKKIKARHAESPRYVFLLSFTLPLWAFYFVMNFWKGTEPNWPAASYFAGMILLGGILSEGWNTPVRTTRIVWRFVGAITVAWGVFLTAFAFNMHRIYPIAAEKLAKLSPADAKKSAWNPARWDQPGIRLRGHAERGRVVDELLQSWTAQEGAAAKPIRIVTSRYDTASSLAFYLPGQPYVGCLMSRVGGRMSQYDVWDPDGPRVNLGDHVLLVGEIARPYLQKMAEISFEHVDLEPQRLPVKYQGVTIREVQVVKCYGFKGKWPEIPADVPK